MHDRSGVELTYWSDVTILLVSIGTCHLTAQLRSINVHECTACCPPKLFISPRYISHQIWCMGPALSDSFSRVLKPIALPLCQQEKWALVHATANESQLLMVWNSKLTVFNICFLWIFFPCSTDEHRLSSTGAVYSTKRFPAPAQVISPLTAKWSNSLKAMEISLNGRNHNVNTWTRAKSGLRELECSPTWFVELLKSVERQGVRL